MKLSHCLCLLILFGASAPEATAENPPTDGRPATQSAADQQNVLRQSPPKSRPSPQGSVNNALYEFPDTVARPAAANSSATVDTNDRAESRRNSPLLAPRPGRISAEGSGDSAATPQGVSFGTILFALGFVIVVFLGLAKLVFRKNPFAITGLPREAIDVLGRRTVDPKNGILVVRVGPKVLLLGTSANGLTTLSEIDDPIEVATLVNICRAEAQPETGVPKWLSRLIPRRDGSKVEPSFVERFGESLYRDTEHHATPQSTDTPVAPLPEGRRVA